MRILVVDDEPAILDATATMLGVEDHVISCASSGQMALELLHAADAPFHLLITDQNMAGMSGKELAIHFKKLSPSTFVALLTGQSTVVAESNLPPSIDCVLAKPIRLAALRNFIRACAAR